MAEELTIDGSILQTVKKKLGISSEDDSFDVDIMICINTAFERLETLGIGPNGGYRISSADNVWTEYLTNEKLIDSVKDYIYMKVKLIFDSSTMSSYLMDAYRKQLDELEFLYICKSDHNSKWNYDSGSVLIYNSYEDLPVPGSEGVLYLVPNRDSERCRFYKYIWINQINDYELIGSDEDVTKYVKRSEISKLNDPEIRQAVEEAYNEIFNQ